MGEPRGRVGVADVVQPDDRQPRVLATAPARGRRGRRLPPQLPTPVTPDGGLRDRTHLVAHRRLPSRPLGLGRVRPSTAPARPTLRTLPGPLRRQPERRPSALRRTRHPPRVRRPPGMARATVLPIEVEATCGQASTSRLPHEPVVRERTHRGSRVISRSSHRRVRDGAVELLLVGARQAGRSAPNDDASSCAGPSEDQSRRCTGAPETSARGRQRTGQTTGPLSEHGGVGMV
jgi:hypothetical protein